MEKKNYFKTILMIVLIAIVGFLMYMLYKDNEALENDNLTYNLRKIENTVKTTTSSDDLQCQIDSLIALKNYQDSIKAVEEREKFIKDSIASAIKIAKQKNTSAKPKLVVVDEVIIDDMDIEYDDTKYIVGYKHIENDSEVVEEVIDTINTLNDDNVSEYFSLDEEYFITYDDTTTIIIETIDSIGTNHLPTIDTIKSEAVSNVDGFINDSNAIGVYLFDDSTYLAEKITPIQANKIKVKTKEKKSSRFIQHQKITASFDNKKSDYTVTENKHIVLCFNENEAKNNEDVLREFSGVWKRNFMHVHKMDVKSNERKMKLDNNVTSSFSTTNSTIDFTVQKISDNIVEIILPSNIQNGEYCLTVDNFIINQNTPYQIFDFTISK